MSLDTKTENYLSDKLNYLINNYGDKRLTLDSFRKMNDGRIMIEVSFTDSIVYFHSEFYIKESSDYRFSLKDVFTSDVNNMYITFKIKDYENVGDIERFMYNYKKYKEWSIDKNNLFNF